MGVSRMPDLKHLATLIENGQVREVDAYTRALLTEGVTPESIVAEGLCRECMKLAENSISRSALSQIC